MQNHSISKRLFLVGCSRSGTTLLQALIASHPRIHSFPETQFFVCGLGLRRRFPALIGLAPPGRAIWAIKLFLKEINRHDLDEMVPKQTFRFRSIVHGYINILDYLALEAETNIWLEKSPLHVYYIRLIRKYVRKVFFIHIIRDGRDVVASLYDRALKYPEMFGEQKDLSVATQYWNRAFTESLKYVGHSGHIFIFYEDVIEKPAQVLAHIFTNIGVSYYSNWQKTVDEMAQQITLPYERWKITPSSLPQSLPSKFEQHFDQKTRDWISNQLKLDQFEALRTKLNL